MSDLYRDSIPKYLRESYELAATSVLDREDERIEDSCRNLVKSMEKFVRAAGDLAVRVDIVNSWSGLCCEYSDGAEMLDRLADVISDFPQRALALTKSQTKGEKKNV